MVTVIWRHCAGIKFLGNMTLHNQANKGLQKNNKIYSHNIIDQTRIKLRDNW